ncbi:hypothetical protein B0H12DRAFT_1149900 [Mycena haematopus]|nr:hypothetical protein B0H12DRAFT_1149900 [Mycena haematopus]
MHCFSPHLVISAVDVLRVREASQPSSLLSKPPSSTLRHRPLPISSASTPHPLKTRRLRPSTSHMQPYANPRPHRPNCPSDPPTAPPNSRIDRASCATPS